MKANALFNACLFSSLIGPAVGQDLTETQMQAMPLADLTRMRVQIDDELRRRGVMRSGNQLTGELAEYLFSQAFGWSLAGNSQKSHDAMHEGVRYQIKARRDYGQGGARQLSAIRDPEGFDFLAVIIFDRFYRVERAAILPVSVIAERASYVAYTNSYRFRCTNEVMGLPGVVDVTDALKR